MPIIQRNGFCVGIVYIHSINPSFNKSSKIVEYNLAQPLNIKKDISSFLSNYKEKLSELFNERNDEDEMLATRGIPPYVLREVLEQNPLSTFIPKEYNGRGAITGEALSMLETTSYQSLPLSLMMGINGALFLQPVANYADDNAQKSVFERFLQKKNMGGLMITEPDYGCRLALIIIKKMNLILLKG
jgi:alkylation response protein AidB-like acyl-CoA dehydrogenase